MQTFTGHTRSPQEVVAARGDGSPTDSLEDKHHRMRDLIRDMRDVAVAFSAGVDSTLVLKVALDVLGPNHVIAVTADSESLARAEFDLAKELAASVGAEHVVLKTREMDNENYRANPENRCYFCKTTLYEQMTELVKRRGAGTIVNGINVDDLGDWRPGIQAAKEHAVRCPVAEADMTKADVRELSRRLGLPTFDKPASPCLSSRVQYGESITPEKLRRIEQCEAVLHELGFRECRVRHHDNLARIEVPVEQIERLSHSSLRSIVVERFREAGYHYVTIDAQGFRSGSMNELISVGIAAGDGDTQRNIGSNDDCNHP